MSDPWVKSVVNYVVRTAMIRHAWSSLTQEFLLYYHRNAAAQFTEEITIENEIHAGLRPWWHCRCSLCRECDDSALDSTSDHSQDSRSAQENREPVD